MPFLRSFFGRFARNFGIKNEEGMLLLLNSGIFYEFIKSDEFFTDNPKRYTIGEVELGVNYVLIISTNAGLWGYNIGDTVQFTSLKPYRVIVSGRIKHYISAFGEHVIADEVEYALMKAANEEGVKIIEFLQGAGLRRQHQDHLFGRLGL